MAQKAKIHWAIEGDENSKYFHAIINKKRSQLAIRGVLVKGDWIDEPARIVDLEMNVAYDVIKRAVWDCGANKSPGRLKINLYKSKLMGIGISQEDVTMETNLIGCNTLTAPFTYLGVKLKTLSIGGCFTLIKSVLSFMPLYHMSIYKVPMDVLNRLESTRRNFFNGVENMERKISMIDWKKVLAAKKKKSRFIKAIFGNHGALDNPGSLPSRSTWIDIIREFDSLSRKGIDLLSHAKKGGAPRGGVEETHLHLLAEKAATVILTNISGRRVSLDKLPTWLNFSLNGIDIPSILYPICNIVGESSSHLLFNYHVARVLLSKVARWWELEILDFHSSADWLTWFFNLRLSKRLKEDTSVMAATVMWCPAKTRTITVPSKPLMTTLPANNSFFMGFVEKQKLTGPNFIDWYRQLKIVLSVEDNLNYLEQEIPPAPVVTAGQLVAPEEERKSVRLYVLKKKGYINNLERLGHPVILGLVKRNCPQYLAELLKKKKNTALGAGGSCIFVIELNTILNRSWIYDTGCDNHICNTTQGLRASRKLKTGALSLYVGNGQREAVEAIGVFYICLPSGLEIVLNNCHYAPSITRGVISVFCLYEDGFINRFVNNTIQVSRNNMVYFSAIPKEGIFEIDLSNSYTNKCSIYAVSNKRAKLDLDSALVALSSWTY
uniref:RNA-directed DNA polymerase, eukaryota n=1 Tax=Tanacetum cinerariifolium TaxID=118510 RepID=A0A6L2MDZ5_TANCI|nr:RNA-directed DNA polymerase, eukaryota [Tanacetum cinerariifolium]